MCIKVIILKCKDVNKNTAIQLSLTIRFSVFNSVYVILKYKYANKERLKYSGANNKNFKF